MVRDQVDDKDALVLAGAAAEVRQERLVRVVLLAFDARCGAVLQRLGLLRPENGNGAWVCGDRQAHQCIATHRGQ